jgi:predicted NUDIX family phosphoesterase
MSKPPVLCVPSDDVARLGLVGFNGGSAFYSLMRLIDFKGMSISRDRAEADPGLKQVCTYCQVRRVGSGAAPFSLLNYERPSDHSRPELKSLLSIGIGGHVDGSDRVDGEEADETVLRAAMRELREEITNFDELNATVTPLGVINTNEGAGLYHIGVVYAVRYDWKKNPTYNTEELIRPNVGPAHMLDLERLEPWSRVLIDSFMTPEFRKLLQKKDFDGGQQELMDRAEQLKGLVERKRSFQPI